MNHEGAVAFCEWLTTTYNAYPKREFKKVIFRLPTKEEWVLAARAGHEHAPFPWGGYYVRNSKGQFLANFKRLPQTAFKRINEDGHVEMELGPDTQFYSLDGALFLAPSNSFLPKDFGIYNFSGNAAEMLAEPGRTKGGSWASIGYFIQIDAEDEFAGYTEPSPKIGFRYFMEVVEK